MNNKNLYLILILLGFNISSFAQPKKVVATASIFADMAEVIAGEQLSIETIVPIGGDPHLYEPIPKDAKMVADADLIIKNGLTFEGWLNELIENSGTKAKVVTISEGVEVIESLTYKNSTDPHAWMSAKNGVKYIENIKNAFSELDPNNADIYDFNYKAYKQQLEDLDASIQTKIESIPEKQRILITSHDAFQYYGRRYGIQLEAILGTSTDAEEQTSDIIRVNKVITNNQVPAIFIESTINPKTLKQLASDNDVEIGGELYADSLGDEDSPAATYYKMLEHNTDVIVKALSRTVEAKKQNEPMQSGSSSNWYLFAIIGILLLGGFFIMAKKMGT